MQRQGSSNRAFPKAWNVSLQVWKVATEIAGSGYRLVAVSSLLFLFYSSSALAQGLPDILPTGESVTAGSGSIGQSGGQMVVNQATDRLAVDWQSFSIGQNNSVTFNQPSASAIALNRVLGSQVSQIQGALNANGRVFLLNPNGIIFSKGSQVNIGGLVASTLGLSNDDFLNDRFDFRGDSLGRVVNQGEINAAGAGAHIALIAASIENSGRLSADKGSVLLGAGSRVTLDQGGPVKLEVEEAAVNALIEQGGAIQADGGLIYLSAKAAGDLAATVINQTGILEARTLSSGERGEIYLLGDMHNDRIAVGGTLDASAPAGGDGGFIETSAARVSFADQFSVTTKAPGGSNGLWLIDPYDFTIAASGGDITGSALSTALGSNAVTIQTLAASVNCSGAACGSGASGGNGDIFVNDSVNWVNNLLTLSAYRNIEINSPLNASSTAGLTLEYGQGALASGNASSYRIKAPINLDSTGSFATKLGSDGIAVSYTIITDLGAAGSSTAADLQGMNGNLWGRYVLGADIDASTTAGWNGEAGFMPVGDTYNSFSGSFDGLGHTITALTVNRPAESSVGGLFGYTRGASISNLGLVGSSVSGHGSVGGLVGNNSDGSSVSNSYATGSVSGFSLVGGLVGNNWGSSVSNSYASGSVSGDQNVGGLVGYNYYSSVSNSYATGSVSGSRYIGGLVGHSWGSSVSNAFTSVSVSGGDYIGGLVGYSHDASIVNNAYASGSVNGGMYIGGLVGYNRGSSVSNAYATGSVSGSVSGGYFSGGLMGGNNAGSVSNAYWNRQTSGQSSSWGSDASAGKTTAAMKTASTFTGWDISGQGGEQTSWRIYEGTTAPLLRSFFTASPTLTVTADGKIYDATTTLSSGLYSLEAGFDSRLIEDSAATYHADSSAVGSRNVFLQGLYSNQMGYDLVFVGGTADITPAPLTVTADDKSKVYGDANPVLTATYSGLKGSDTAAVVSGLTLNTSATSGSDVGAYSINAAGGTTTNYILSYTNGALTITPAPLTVTADDKSKVYGASIPVLTASYSGLKGADTAAVVSGLTLSTGATSGSDVGAYSISAAGGTTTNYILSYTNGALAIAPAPLTVTADDKNKVYGASIPVLTASYSGLKGADTSAVVSNLTLNTSATSGSDVGAYSINAADGTATNYTLSYTNGALAITPAPLTVTADDKNKVYGASIPVLTASYSGLKGADTSAVVSDLTLNTSATSGSDVGAYSINAADGTATNYTLSYTNGALIITPAPLTVTADDKNKAYGDANPVLTATYSGLQGSDTAAVVSGLTLNTSATSTSVVGAYSISAAGGTTTNYILSYTNGALAIAPAPLTVTADDKNKVYGASIPVLTASYSGLKGADTSAVVSNLTLNTSATSGSDVGAYSINAADGTATNYTLSYTNGALIITPAPLTVTADDKNKAYGDANPVLTATYSGLQGSDTAAVVSGLTLNTSATSTSVVGAYSISAADGTATNYTLSYTNGALIITPAPLTVTADDKNKAYGDANPVLTATYSGLQGSDTAAVVSGLTLNTSATSTSVVGAYSISAADGTATNYTLSFNDGVLSIIVNQEPLQTGIKSAQNLTPALNSAARSGALQPANPAWLKPENDNDPLYEKLVLVEASDGQLNAMAQAELAAAGFMSLFMVNGSINLPELARSQPYNGYSR